MTNPALSRDQIRHAVLAQRDYAESLFQRLADGSPGHPGTMRDTYCTGENFAHDLLRSCGAEQGIAVTTDVAQCTYVTWPGTNRTLPRIIIGSHLDSVPNGGNFDGAAGVIAGLVATAALRSLGVNPARDIVTMGVRAEESGWFQVSYVGSRSALGTLPDGALHEHRRIVARAAHIRVRPGAPSRASVREQWGRVRQRPRGLRQGSRGIARDRL